MKTDVCLWYLTEFLLEWEMFLTKVVENSKHTFSIIFFFFFQKIMPCAR